MIYYLTKANSKKLCARRDFSKIAFLKYYLRLSKLHLDASYLTKINFLIVKKIRWWKKIYRPETIMKAEKVGEG